jgi:hypothetical protein
VDDSNVMGRIEELVEEEQTLLHSEEGHDPDPEQRRRLEQVKVELDRCWDLLRQRRAREEFGQDPHEAQVRDADTVERYLQ